MTERSNTPSQWDSPAMRARIRRRHRLDRLMQTVGKLCVAVSVLAVTLLFFSIVSSGWSGFFQTTIDVDIYFDPEIIGDPQALTADQLTEAIETADMRRLLLTSLIPIFPEARSRGERRRLLQMFSIGIRGDLRRRLRAFPGRIGTTERLSLLASDDIDQAIKGNIDLSQSEANRRIKDLELSWLRRLQAEDRVHFQFNTLFFTSGDSREPELAGIYGAFMGTVLTVAVTILLALPLGVLAAIYLEEFSRRGWWTDFIEVNINNLAAVPPLLFGLLGLVFFLGVLDLPRSSALVAGLTLTLMTSVIGV